MQDGPRPSSTQHPQRLPPIQSGIESRPHNGLEDLCHLPRVTSRSNFLLLLSLLGCTGFSRLLETRRAPTLGPLLFLSLMLFL